MLRLTPVVILVLLLPACKRESMGDCFKRAGQWGVEARPLESFSRLVAEDNVDVFIETGNAYAARVEAGQNLIPLVKTEVKDGRLTVRNDNRCNWVRSFKNAINVYLTVPSLTEVTLDGSGVIKGLDTLKGTLIHVYLKRSGDIDLLLDVGECLTHIHAAGDVILGGRAGVHQAHAVGNGWIRCAGLKTGYTYLWNYSTGESYIHAEKEIGVHIYAAGNVYYSGKPPFVNSVITGEGRLIAVE